MKAKIFTVLGSLVVSSILYAQNIQVTDKWQLLGALENISSSSFDGKCVDFVWKYDNGWQVHIANGKNYNLPSGIIKFDTINKGEGFWVKGNGSCDVNTKNIVGSWYMGNASQTDSIVVLTFFSNGSYVMLQDGDSNEDPNGIDGMERGTYSVDKNGVLTTNTITDTNGEWGLSHPKYNMVVSVNDNTLTITEGDEVYTATRVQNIDNSIVGSWYMGNASQTDNIVVLTFFSNGSYVMLQDGDSNEDPNGIDGIERGTYSVDKNGVLTTNTITDTNGEWGLSHPKYNMVVSVNDNTLTITEGDEVYTAHKITISNE